MTAIQPIRHSQVWVWGLACLLAMFLVLVTPALTGDLFHNPLQMAHPDWTDNADVDGAQAHETRKKFLADYADGPVLVLGTHFAAPTAGRIVRDGDAYRFDV